MSAEVVPTRLSLELTTATRSRLAELVRRTGRSEAAVARDAVDDYVERELATLDAIGTGLADMAAGRVVPHDEAMRRIRAAITSVSSGE